MKNKQQNTKIFAGEKTKPELLKEEMEKVVGCIEKCEVKQPNLDDLYLYQYE